MEMFTLVTMKEKPLLNFLDLLGQIVTTYNTDQSKVKATMPVTPLLGVALVFGFQF